MDIRPDGCGPLYQWDTGRSVTVDGLDPGSTVHFALYGSDRAYVVEPDGETAGIPNQVLQDGRDVCVYAVTGGRTMAAARLMVRRRAKPDGYVYEPTEVAETATKKWVLEQLASVAGFEIATDEEIDEKIGEADA